MSVPHSTTTTANNSTSSSATSTTTNSNGGSSRFRGDAASFSPRYPILHHHNQPQHNQNPNHHHQLPPHIPVQQFIHPQMQQANLTPQQQQQFFMQYNNYQYPMMMNQMYGFMPYQQEIYQQQPQQMYMIPPPHPLPQSHIPMHQPPPPIPHSHPSPHGHNNSNNLTSTKQNTQQTSSPLLPPQIPHQRYQKSPQSHNIPQKQHQYQQVGPLPSQNQQQPKHQSQQQPQVHHTQQQPQVHHTQQQPQVHHTQQQTQESQNQQHEQKQIIKESEQQEKQQSNPEQSQTPERSIPNSSDINSSNNILSEETESSLSQNFDEDEDHESPRLNGHKSVETVTPTLEAEPASLVSLPLFINIKEMDFLNNFLSTEQSRNVKSINISNQLEDNFMRKENKVILCPNITRQYYVNSSKTILSNGKDQTDIHNIHKLTNDTKQENQQQQQQQQQQQNQQQQQIPDVCNSQGSPALSSNWASFLQATAPPTPKKVVRKSSPAKVEPTTYTKVKSSTPDIFNLENESTQPLGILLLKIMFDTNYSIFNNFPVFEIKPKGLTNTGNICFMNSILQTLLYCEPFNKLLKLIETKAIGDLVTSSQPLIDATIKLFNEFKPSDDKSPVSIETFYSALSKHKKFQHLKWGQQEDAEEFLGYYLDALNEEMISALKKLNTPQIDSLIQSYESDDITKFKYNIKTCIRRIKNEEDDDEWKEVSKKNVTKIEIEPTPLNMIFGGEFKSVISIPKATSFQKSITLDPFQHVQLDISNSESVEDAFIHLNELESISYKGQNNKDLLVKKQTFIEKLPNVLIIHLKRFSYSSQNQENAIEKIGKNITYNHTLIIPNEILSQTQQQQPQSSQSQEYQLNSVVYHHGSSADAGHYTSDTFDFENNQWWRIDDTIVKPISDEDVLNDGINNAYILIFSATHPFSSFQTSISPSKIMAKTRSKGPVSPVANKIKSPGKVTKPRKVSSKEKKISSKNSESLEDGQAEHSTESNSSIIPSSVIKKAIIELEKYITRDKQEKQESNEKSKSQLFDEDVINEANTLYLIIESKKFFSAKPQFKPKTIKLSKSMYNFKELKTCLIIRDQLVKTNEEIEKIENENLPTISQILPLKSLKTEYKPFEKRREFRNDYDLFLADEAILNTLPNVLGKVFYDSNNKVPLPVRVTNSSNNSELSITTLKNQLDKILNSTFYLPPQGTVVSIKVGHISNEDEDETKFTNDELSDNVRDIVKSFDLDTLKTIMIKTGTSPAIPLFYTDKLYTDEDILDDITSTEADEEVNVELTPFEKGLLQLGDLETVSKVLGKKLETRSLSPETNLTVGRDETHELVFNSMKCARNLLQIVTGPTNPNQKTSLILFIQSRAKSYINGKLVNLKKGENPKELIYTAESKIDINCEQSTDPSANSDFPLLIEWIDLKLYIDTQDELVDQLKKLNMDLPIVDSVDKATHIYTNKAVPDSNNFKRAIILGKHVVNDTWLESLISNPNDVDNWLLASQDSKFLPDNNNLYLPSTQRAISQKILSFESIGWIDCEIVDKTEEDIKNKAGSSTFILVSKEKFMDLKSISENELWSAILNNNTASLPTNTIQNLKRAADSNSKGASGARKRRKYEKVDKLHFFSLGSTSTPTTQNNNTQESLTTQPAAQTDGEKSRTTTPNTETIPDSETQEIIQQEQPKPPRLEKIKKEPEDPPPVNYKKRQNESFTNHQPPKVAKFMPKVSFADAVIQARETSVKKWNKEMGINETSEDQEVVLDDLSNLAIVEIVDMPMRNKNLQQPQTDQLSVDINVNVKNFKRFRKNKPPTQHKDRPIIEMTISDTNVFIPKSKKKETTVDNEFEGVMDNVRGYNPTPLFVEDSDNEEDEEESGPYDENGMSSFKNFTSRGSTINTDNETTTNFNSATRITNSNKTPNDKYDDDEEDDDDDEDNDDQPKFGFSR
ncbi:uncharacterized protein KGF55_002773 [Candida pseudojiufengensis]|uniref:uncharacterized protein n=1 Tax=Candida pseudojiufengensis TaxID=497109 RepID=UPI0022247A8C|nr:uncharacterized protein KGF55_002773 [Candida pseudojiufengensis]KAI5962981.1 hypothetical protein KGF55_002773 [Candida pseudojiufengensis]